MYSYSRVEQARSNSKITYEVLKILLGFINSILNPVEAKHIKHPVCQWLFTVAILETQVPA